MTVKSATMRAARVLQPGHIAIESVPLPVPNAGEVRIKLEGSGVCASNLPPWEGREWFSYPLDPGGLGHEGWGVIDAVGDEVTTFHVGDRVAALSQHAYAEYDVADARDVIPLPATLAGQPFPGEPLGCAINIFRRADIRAGQTVVIVGIGFLGALLISLAIHAGANVIAVAHRPFAQQVAKEMGAQIVIPMDDHYQIIEQVKTLTDGDFCPVVIECTGKQWPLDLSAELCGVRGRLVIAGYHQDGPRQVNLQLWNWRGLDVINAHERDPEIYREGMEAAVQAVESGTLNPLPLYTHRFSLENLGDALNATAARPDGFLKALVVYE